MLSQITQKYQQMIYSVIVYVFNWMFQKCFYFHVIQMKKRKEEKKKFIVFHIKYLGHNNMNWALSLSLSVCQ